MTTSAIEIACFGDLMLECIIYGASLPRPNSTMVLDSPGQAVGGAAFNLCWNLLHLGSTPRLVACVGSRQLDMVREVLRASGLVDSGLVEVAGDSDLLISFVQGSTHHSVYLRGSLSDSVKDQLRARTEGERCLVLTGNRHPLLRQVSVRLADEFSGELIAFSPGYAVYEYPRDELQLLLQKAGIAVMNEEEATYVCRVLSASGLEGLARTLPGIFIVTLAHRGARAFAQEQVVSIESYTRSSVDVIGAGDAFLSGFLVERLRGADLLSALHFASMCGAYVVETGRVRAEITRLAVQKRFAGRGRIA